MRKILKYAGRTLLALLGLLALALLAILVTNTVAWTYQYLLVGALLWIGLMLRAEPNSDVAGGERASQ